MSEILPGELMVAVLWRLGTYQRTELNLGKLRLYFANAAKQWQRVWKEFSFLGSGFSETLVSLLSGGSLVYLDASLQTIRSTSHTLGPYGEGLYKELGIGFQKQIDELCGWLIRAHNT